MKMKGSIYFGIEDDEKQKIHPHKILKKQSLKQLTINYYILTLYLLLML